MCVGQEGGETSPQFPFPLTFVSPLPFFILFLLSTAKDAVDPVYAPSTGTRVAGGLNYREAYFLCESVARTGKHKGTVSLPSCGR